MEETSGSAGVKVTRWTGQQRRFDSPAPLTLLSALPGMLAGLSHPSDDFPTWLSIVSAFPRIKVKVILCNDTLEGYAVGGLNVGGQSIAINTRVDTVDSPKINIPPFSFVSPFFTV